MAGEHVEQRLANLAEQAPGQGEGVCAYIEALLEELAKLAAREGEKALAVAIAEARDEATESLARRMRAQGA